MAHALDCESTNLAARTIRATAHLNRNPPRVVEQAWSHRIYIVMCSRHPVVRTGQGKPQV